MKLKRWFTLTRDTSHSQYNNFLNEKREKIKENPVETTSDFMEKNNKDTENMSSLSQVVIEIDKEQEQKEVINNELEHVNDDDLVFIELDKYETSVTNTQKKKDKSKRKYKTCKDTNVTDMSNEINVSEGIKEPKVSSTVVEELKPDKSIEKKQKRVKLKSVMPTKKSLDKRTKENLQATVFGLCFLVVVGGLFLWFEFLSDKTTHEQLDNNTTVVENTLSVPDISTTVMDNSVENIVDEPKSIPVIKEYIRKDDDFYANFDITMIERIRSYFYDTIREDLQIISCEKYDWSIYDTTQEYVWIVVINNQGIDEYYRCHITVDFNDEIIDITHEDISEEYGVSNPVSTVEESVESVE